MHAASLRAYEPDHAARPAVVAAAAARAVVVIGEALVDEFHDGAVPGGAPFNVARSLAALGAPTCFISRIGATDAHAALLLESAGRYGLATAGMQRDPGHATGRVSVHESAGAHRFEIHGNAAWDHIAIVAAQQAIAEQAPRAGFVYFGSLAQRGPMSRASIRALVGQAGGLRFLDLNLRAGVDTRELAGDSLALADWVKVNDEELATLLAWFAPANQGVPALMDRFGLQALLVTRGAAGYQMLDGQGRVVAQGSGVDQPAMVDTVGAGDAFTALLLAGLAQGRALPETLALANRYAAMVCGVRGPLPADAAALDPWRAALRALPASGVQA